MGGGDYEEHAILLANYFMYIDEKRAPGRFQTMLIYGYGVPEGKNVFVLRKWADPSKEKDGRDIEIWSPMTGECFNFQNKIKDDFWCGLQRGGNSMTTRQHDPICPLRHIYSLVSQDNIYANI